MEKGILHFQQHQRSRIAFDGVSLESLWTKYAEVGKRGTLSLANHGLGVGNRRKKVTVEHIVGTTGRAAAIFF